MIAPGPHVAFRVDGSVGIGTGHVMRCVALADELRARGAVVRFVCRHLPETLEALVRGRGHDVARLPPAARDAGAHDLAHGAWLGASQAEDAAATLAALSDVPRWDWLVVDHYGLDARWEEPLRARARRILAIDDLADRPHAADALLDSSCLTPERARRYDPLVPAACRRLLGPRFALLRPEFRAARQRPRARGGRFRVNVCFGGTDPDGATLDALRALELVGDEPELAVDVVIGAANPRRAEVQERCRRLAGATLHVDAPDVAELLARADLAIGAGGGMTWERCCVGVPSVSLSIADNQRLAAQELARARVQLDGGPAAALDPRWLAATVRRLRGRERLRRGLGRRAAALVDGRGAERLGLFLLKGPLTLRRATQGDARPAWTWRNDPAGRRYAGDPAEIPWESHERWWAASLRTPERALVVIESRGTPLGVVRFDVEGEEAVVSLYHDPALHGLGLGGATLDAGAAWARENLPAVRALRGIVLAENAASRRSVESAGWAPTGRENEWRLPLSRVEVRR